MNGPLIEPLGDSAILVRLGDHIDSATSDAALALADRLGAAMVPGIVDIAPAYASVCVRYDIAAFAGTPGSNAPCEHVIAWIRTNLGSPAKTGDTEPSAAATVQAIEIPVCYGGAFGADLDAVAEHARLGADEVVARHARAEYRVAMLGFMPGFPYLLGLDPQLHMPRRPEPRTRVPAGSVAIGGAQTGIYPRELPGGWQLIGRTPLRLFDALRAEPALLRSGSRVRFRAIDAAAFAALSS